MIQNEGTTCPECGTSILNIPEGGRFCAKCRFPLMHVANKYRLIKTLAEGGFGTVFLAKHIRLQEDAMRVIKVMKPEVMKIAGMETRFYREVRITSSLSQKNEHIVRIYDDFGEEEGLGFYYVMEHLHGRPLSHRLQEGHLTPVEIQNVFEQMTKGIAEAHRAGIIHRDLKPDNIMLVEKGHQTQLVKLLDFGIAKPLGDNSQPNLTQGMLGTPAYMSPEQCLGQEIGREADIYAVGIILYELFTGRPPFGGNTDQAQSSNGFMAVLHAHITQQVPSLREKLPQMPQGIEAAILKSLAKKPENRFGSMEELYQDIAPKLASWTGIPLQAPELLDAPTPRITRSSYSQPSGELIPAAQSYAPAPPTQIPHSSPLSKGLILGMLVFMVLLTAGLGYTIYLLKQEKQPTPRTNIRTVVRKRPTKRLHPPKRPRPHPPEARTQKTIKKAPQPTKRAVQPPPRRPKKRTLRKVTIARKRFRRRYKRRRIKSRRVRRAVPIARVDIDRLIKDANLTSDAEATTRRFFVEGKKLERSIRNGMTARTYLLARRVHRIHKDLLMYKLPSALYKQLGKYEAMGVYALIQVRRKRFAKFQYQGQSNAELGREYTKHVNALGSYIALISKLFRFRSSNYYPCGSYYFAEAYLITADAMANSPQPAQGEENTYYKLLKNSASRYRTMAMEQLRPGLQHASNYKAPKCHKKMVRMYKRLRQ
tara:strand:- start:1543 stop:3663 length:2121 start_codon:yes stop_codon:yes gene_type:complete